MQIGIDVSCWGNKRGFGRFTREIVYALAKCDPSHKFILFLDGADLQARDMPSNVSVCSVPTKQKAIEAASAEGRRSLRDILAMTRQVMRHRLDVFFFPAVYSYYPILNRTRIVLTIHDMIPELHPLEVFPNKKLRLFWQLKQKIALLQSDIVLTVSDFSKKHIVEHCKLPESKVRVIHEGPGEAFRVIEDKGKISKVLSRYGIAMGEPYFLYVGGLSPHKNLGTLVKAFTVLISEEKFRNVRLVLVGDYQTDSFFSDYPVLKEMVKKKNLSRQVIFTGFIEDGDLACLYNAASSLVFPSLLEGFGLPAVEAMACGTPVIASNRGSLPEVLGKAGKFFDPLDEETLISLLKLILTDSDLRETMKFSGLSRARHYVWENAAIDLMKIFQGTPTFFV